MFRPVLKPDTADHLATVRSAPAFPSHRPPCAHGSAETSVTSRIRCACRSDLREGIADLLHTLAGDPDTSEETIHGAAAEALPARSTGLVNRCRRRRLPSSRRVRMR
jgi:hypothetical protein